MSRLAKARQRVAEFYALSAAARPGEVWTAHYVGPDCDGNPFESYTAGTVRILGEECPVVEYRGEKVLGEVTLDMERPRLWAVLGRLYMLNEALHGDGRTLTRGDTAPTPPSGGPSLADLPTGTRVTVEYRGDHPVYEGLRNVVTGVLYDEDERSGEKGRDVGGDWVPYEQVTGLVVHESEGPS